MLLRSLGGPWARAVGRLFVAALLLALALSCGGSNPAGPHGGHGGAGAGGSANPATLETVATGQHTMKMDGKAALRFWRKYKDWIFQTIELCPAKPTQEADQ